MHGLSDLDKKQGSRVASGNSATLPMYDKTSYRSVVTWEMDHHPIAIQTAA
jgi:hypothetical protein